MKDYEFFKSYYSNQSPEVDIAWTDAFPGAAAWLADRERRRKEQEKNAPEADRPGNWREGTFGGDFNRNQ